jgi:hypothetical protein
MAIDDFEKHLHIRSHVIIQEHQSRLLAKSKLQSDQSSEEK